MSGSDICWAICKSAPRFRQITTPAPHHSVFLQAGCPSCRPTNSVKALKANFKKCTQEKIGCFFLPRRSVSLLWLRWWCDCVCSERGEAVSWLARSADRLNQPADVEHSLDDSKRQTLQSATAGDNHHHQRRSSLRYATLYEMLV